MKAMKRLDIIIRPEKLEKLKEILEKKDYSGMTVFTAMGCGYQEGFIPEFEEMNFEINLLPKVVVMVVVWEEDVEDLLELSMRNWPPDRWETEGSLYPRWTM